jgi:hypothetical protein
MSDMGMLRQRLAVNRGLPARVRIAAGWNAMKRRFVVLILAVLSVGCDVRPHLRSAKGLSTEPATWKGRSGTAVTIDFKDGTEQFWRAEEVTFLFDNGKSPRFYSKEWKAWGKFPISLCL